MISIELTTEKQKKALKLIMKRLHKGRTTRVVLASHLVRSGIYDNRGDAVNFIQEVINSEKYTVASKAGYVVRTDRQEATA